MGNAPQKGKKPRVGPPCLPCSICSMEPGSVRSSGPGEEEPLRLFVRSRGVVSRVLRPVPPPVRFWKIGPVGPVSADSSATSEEQTRCFAPTTRARSHHCCSRASVRARNDRGSPTKVIGHLEVPKIWNYSKRLFPTVFGISGSS